MDTERMISICSETVGLRGQFREEPGLWRGICVAGYIDPLHGRRVYVINNKVVNDMLRAGLTYFIVSADVIQSTEDASLAAIRSFVPMHHLESPGEMACGF